MFKTNKIIKMVILIIFSVQSNSSIEIGQEEATKFLLNEAGDNMGRNVEKNDGIGNEQSQNKFAYVPTVEDEMLLENLESNGNPDCAANKKTIHCLTQDLLKRIDSSCMERVSCIGKKPSLQQIFKVEAELKQVGTCPPEINVKPVNNTWSPKKDDDKDKSEKNKQYGEKHTSESGHQDIGNGAQIKRPHAIVYDKKEDESKKFKGEYTNKDEMRKHMNIFKPILIESVNEKNLIRMEIVAAESQLTKPTKMYLYSKIYDNDNWLKTHFTMNVYCSNGYDKNNNNLSVPIEFSSKELFEYVLDTFNIAIDDKSEGMSTEKLEFLHKLSLYTNKFNFERQSNEYRNLNTYIKIENGQKNKKCEISELYDSLNIENIIKRIIDLNNMECKNGAIKKLGGFKKPLNIFRSICMLAKIDSGNYYFPVEKEINIMMTRLSFNDLYKNYNTFIPELFHENSNNDPTLFSKVINEDEILTLQSESDMYHTKWILGLKDYNKSLSEKNAKSEISKKESGAISNHYFQANYAIKNNTIAFDGENVLITCDILEIPKNNAGLYNNNMKNELFDTDKDLLNEIQNISVQITEKIEKTSNDILGKLTANIVKLEANSIGDPNTPNEDNAFWCLQMQKLSVIFKLLRNLLKTFNILRTPNNGTIVYTEKIAYTEKITVDEDENNKCVFACQKVTKFILPKLIDIYFKFYVKNLNLRLYMLRIDELQTMKNLLQVEKEKLITSQGEINQCINDCKSITDITCLVNKNTTILNLIQYIKIFFDQKKQIEICISRANYHIKKDEEGYFINKMSKF